MMKTLGLTQCRPHASDRLSIAAITFHNMQGNAPRSSGNRPESAATFTSPHGHSHGRCSFHGCWKQRNQDTAAIIRIAGARDRPLALPARKARRQGAQFKGRAAPTVRPREPIFSASRHKHRQSPPCESACTRARGEAAGTQPGSPAGELADGAGTFDGHSGRLRSIHRAHGPASHVCARTRHRRCRRQRVPEQRGSGATRLPGRRGSALLRGRAAAGSPPACLVASRPAQAFLARRSRISVSRSSSRVGAGGTAGGAAAS